MSTTVDMRWPIQDAGRIPLQHQYILLSAIARLVPSVHECNSLGIHPIRGRRIKPGFLEIADNIALIVRSPVEQIPILMGLSGKRLDIGGFPVRLGVPQLLALRPSPGLRSFLVTIKGYQDDDGFQSGVRRQLQAATISPSVAVILGPRRILRIKKAAIVGYEVRLDGLTPSESLRLQQCGIGGRRHMGCGLFNPVRHVCPAQTDGVTHG